MTFILSFFCTVEYNFNKSPSQDAYVYDERSVGRDLDIRGHSDDV